MNPLLAIDIDGSIYPCDYFWKNTDFKIGNIFEMSLDEASESKNNFRNYRNVENIEECGICDWKRFCGRGCPGGSETQKNRTDIKSFIAIIMELCWNMLQGKFLLSIK